MATIITKHIQEVVVDGRMESKLSICWSQDSGQLLDFFSYTFSMIFLKFF